MTIILLEIGILTSFELERAQFEGWQLRKRDMGEFKFATDRLEWERKITPGNFSNKLCELCDTTIPNRKVSRNDKPQKLPSKKGMRS